MADGSHHIMAVPMSAADLDMVGVITEALCAESYKTVVPAYYDVALKVKMTRDEESVEMLDLVTSSCMFDFGYVYDNWAGCSFFLQSLVAAKDTNFESYYASKESAASKHYEKVVSSFDEYMN